MTWESIFGSVGRRALKASGGAKELVELAGLGRGNVEGGIDGAAGVRTELCMSPLGETYVLVLWRRHDGPA